MLRARRQLGSCYQEKKFSKAWNPPVAAAPIRREWLFLTVEKEHTFFLCHTSDQNLIAAAAATGRFWVLDRSSQ